jgi:hypothetical protein
VRIMLEVVYFGLDYGCNDVESTMTRKGCDNMSHSQGDFSSLQSARLKI